MTGSGGSCSPTTAVKVGERPAARWLCEVASGADRLDDVLDEPATERMVAHLDAMLARHAAGEPLAYVLGRWGFRHLDLAVDRRVLIPRPETEVVAGVAIELAAALARPITVADLGTGSGAIGLALADELPVEGVTVWLTDESPDALDVARANLAGIGRRAANVRVAEGSWFDALPAGTRARPRRVQPALRRRRARPTSTTPCATGSRTRRCSPAPTGSTPSASVVDAGAALGATRWLAGAGDRGRPGRVRRAPAHRVPATRTSRSAPTSPGGIGSAGQPNLTAMSESSEPSSGVTSSSTPTSSRAAENSARRSTRLVMRASMESSRSVTVPSAHAARAVATAWPKYCS